MSDPCHGFGFVTPVVVENAGGLPAVVRRVGNQRRFKASMLANVALSKGPMARFDARTDDDWTVALLDAASATLDVLAFYSERISNEAYLRTFAERRSGMELARLVGYRPRSGVAASTALAFEMEETPGAPDSATIPAGFRIQSTPAQDESPQKFETTAPLVARRGYGALRLRRSQPQVVYPYHVNLVLDGTANPPRRGDGLLYQAEGFYYFGVVAEVGPEGGDTRIRLAKATKLCPADAGLLPAPAIPLASTLAAALIGKSVSQAKLESDRQGVSPSVDDLFRILNAPIPGQADPALPNARTARYGDAPSAGVLVFRARTGLFGASAPPWGELPNALRYPTFGLGSDKIQDFLPAPYPSLAAWVDVATAASAFTGGVVLDSVQPGFAVGTPVVLVQDGLPMLSKVTDASEISHRQFGISARATLLRLTPSDRLQDFHLRATTVYGAPETLRLAREPRGGFVLDDLLLEGYFRDLKPGGRLAIRGDAVSSPGIVRTEIATIAEVGYVFPDGVHDGGTRVKLERPLSALYLPEGTTINANVAPATHGETVAEILGSGDGRKAFSRFALRQNPLTYVGAANETGVASTLRVYVGGVLWHEVATLDGLPADARAFVTTPTDDGGATILFGDGRTGARLPTGTENVQARYRRGIGAVGNLPSGAINVPLSRPPGLKGASNLVPSEGGGDPDTAEDLRRNLPLGMTTLGRIVTLPDYADFARAFSGVAKARVEWRTIAGRRTVLVHVVGPAGRPIDPGGDLAKRLTDALREASDPALPIRVGGVRILTYNVEGTAVVAPDFRADDVRAAIEATLRTRLGFDARDLGQAVFPSEIVALIQRVPGVRYVDIDRLAPKSGATTPAGALVRSANALILLDDAPLKLTVNA